VRPRRFLRIGSLRYFDPTGAFVGDLAAVVGGPVPKPLEAVRYTVASGPEIILAFRSPTETLVLCDALEPFASIERFAADRQDGCLVEQTGGIWCCTLAGERAPDLLTRLGPTSLIPALGQVRTGRLAELAVMSLCIRSGDIMLLVDRVYADHLTAWMRETIADL
jgi:sarcosine oxidase gamma subunit